MKQPTPETSKKARIPRGARREILEKSQRYIDLMEACAAYAAVCAPAIREPSAAYALMRPLIDAAADSPQESFYVILLDTKLRVLGAPVECTRGLINTTPVHPREVFRPAIQYSASSIILAHNHPTGDPTPSSEDLAITRHLIDAGKLIGISIADHLIIGRPCDSTPAGYVSLRGNGLCDFPEN